MMTFLAACQWHIALLLSLLVLYLLLSPLVSATPPASYPEVPPPHSPKKAPATNNQAEVALLEEYLLQEQAHQCGRLSDAQWHHMQESFKTRYIQLVCQREAAGGQRQEAEASTQQEQPS